LTGIRLRSKERHLRSTREDEMVDLKTVVKDVRDTLVADLGEHLLALYLFGSAARGEYVPGRSDVDLLLVVDPRMPLVAARETFRTVWGRHAEVLVKGPMVATPEDLALHLELFPSLHRALLADALRFHGEAMLKHLPPPPPPDPVEEAATIAARTINYATALTPDALTPEHLRRLTKLLDRLARRSTGKTSPQPFTARGAVIALHAKLRELSEQLPQYNWEGAPPEGDVPDLLPGCLAFYQREKHLITVLERVDEETLSGVDWGEVGAAAEDAYAQFGMATPWQLRLAASELWVDSLYFKGFEHMWGAEIIEDLEADEPTLLRQLARVASEQRVEEVPQAYLSIEGAAVSKLVHDTQNVLLNAGLRAELFARLTGREFDLPDWTPPNREVPQPERVGATWERWREITAYYAEMWKQVGQRG
jgi:predicted nucleotidyltransferase